MSSISMGHLLTVTPDSFFSVVTILQLFRTCSVFSLQPQRRFKRWHQWLDPALEFDQSHHTTLSFSLAVSHPLWLVTTLRTLGLWFLSWPQNVISGMEKSSVGQAGCPVSLCGVPGVWHWHMGSPYLQVSGEICFPQQRVQCGFWTFFSFVLFLWCL